MPNPNPNQMLVEGVEDCHAIVHLMKAYVEWPEERSKCPVEIEVQGSCTEILNRPKLTAKLKSSGLKRLGIVIDADDSASIRWNSLRNTLESWFPDMPREPLARGWIGEHDDLRVGIWIMPDNESEGMLENFLRFLVPASSEAILAYAERAVKTARKKGAPCIEKHVPKAIIHTWLAWQEPPGEKFGIAITRRVLDPMSGTARPFVEWFANLYEMDLKHFEKEKLESGVGGVSNAVESGVNIMDSRNAPR